MRYVEFTGPVEALRSFKEVPPPGPGAPRLRDRPGEGSLRPRGRAGGGMGGRVCTQIFARVEAVGVMDRGGGGLVHRPWVRAERHAPPPVHF